MSLDLDDETLEQLGWGDPMRWLMVWWQRRRTKIIRDEQDRDPLKSRLRERARNGRQRSDEYMKRKRQRDAKRIAAKRARTS